MMRLTLVFIIVFLVGCQSEIDKCVDIEMKAWKVENDVARMHNEKNKMEIEEAENHNKKISEEFKNIAAENHGSSKKTKNDKGENIDDDFVPFASLDFKKVDRKIVDSTPEEVVEAIKRRMCIKILK